MIAHAIHVVNTYRVTYIGMVVCSHVSGALDGSDGAPRDVPDYRTS